MKNNVSLAQITMNAGLDLPMDYVIRHNLQRHSSYFAKSVVVDGNCTKAAMEFYNKIPNVVCVDSPWCDSYVSQYQAGVQLVDDDDWCLYLDADEMPSDSLLNFIFQNSLNGEVNMIRLPCVLYLCENEGDRIFYAAEKEPAENFSGQWTKPILFKKQKSLQYYVNGSHVQPTHGKNEKTMYIPYPYFHFKSLKSFVENDVYQAFLHPAAQGFSAVNAAQFQSLVRSFKTMKDFRVATKDGKWPIFLQKFAWDNRLKYNNSVSRLFWTYHILYGHKCVFGNDENMNWENVKKHVLSEDCMKIYEESKINNRKIIIGD